MPNIISDGDKYKKIVKIAIGWARKKLGANVEKVHEELEVCGNPIFARIAVLINATADNIDAKYQSKVVRELGELFLWILYKDTAYRDMVFWILWQLLEDPERLKKELEYYVKDPEEWYVNVWVRTKAQTKKLQDEGKISKTRKAPSESIFTPTEQAQLLKKYGK